MAATERQIGSVVKNMAAGFSTYTLLDLERAEWCKEAKGVGDIPDTAHWQILVLDQVTTWSGYKEDTGTRTNVWRIFVFEDEKLWEQAVQFYFDDAADPDSPTHKQYGSGPLKMVALDCSGRVIPHISVALARDPRG